MLSIKHWCQSAFAEMLSTVRHSREARQRRASMLVTYTCDCAQWYGAAMSMVFIQIKHVYCLVIGQVVGDKLAKRPRGHVITSLLQFEQTST